MQTVTIRSRTMKALTEALCEANNNAIRACALEYKFPVEEAISKFGSVEVVDGKSKKKQKKKKETVAKPGLTLPFCGVALDGFCQGIKLNRGLYTQCMMMPAGEGQFCTTCARQCASNANGLPNYGTIAQRVELGASWTDGKGKTPVNYGNVMLKLNITKDAAVAEAEKFGMTIPEEQFEVVKAKKGRPAKAKKEKDANAAPKKRGRPKKTKKVVTGGAGDDLIANLVAQAQANTQVEETEEKVEVVVVEQPKAKKADRKPKKTAEEKEAEKLAKAEARAEAKAKKAAEKKAAKEAEKLAKAEARAEAKAKKAAEKKAAKEAEKTAKKAAKEAEKLMNAVAKQEDLEDAKTTKTEQDDEISVETLQDMAAELTLEDHVETGDEEDEDDEVEVEKFEFEGTEYLRDGNGAVYDMESQEEIGTWDGEKLIPLAQDSEDEEDLFMA